jgi:hypothetical protein
MPYTITLKHVRYGRVEFDLGELRRRCEFRLAAGSKAPGLGPLLVRTKRVMALIDDLDNDYKRWDGKRALDAELALLLLDWELVQAILAGRAAPRVPRRPARTLPWAKRPPSG